MNIIKNTPSAQALYGIRTRLNRACSTILHYGRLLKLPFSRHQIVNWRQQTAGFFLPLRLGDRTVYGMFALAVFSTTLISWFCVQVFKVNHAALNQPEPVVSESLPDFAELESLFDQAYQPFRSAKISQHAVALRKETVNWIGVLQDLEDRELPNRLIVKKYHNLCIAASILSAIGKEPGKQRQWSGLAIGYGRQAARLQKARQLMAAAGDDASRKLREDINISILLAMALNYYQRGDVSVNDLKLQYIQINKDYLFRSGFCHYEILRALDDDEIIELPGYHSLKNT